MVKVAYQGVAGANSEIAIYGYFGETAEPVPCHTFADLFAAVTSGRAAFGVVPLENSLAGSVIDNYDLLLKQPVSIVGELYLQVRHQLLALPGVGIGQVHRVFSHPQALAQSSEYLAAHPNMRPEPAFDTAGAAKLIAENGWRDSAAIASRSAARRYGLEILAPDIQSNTENYTRMAVIATDAVAPGGDVPVKTSIFAGLQHESGSLARLLGVLHSAGVNLTKIESRPIVGRPWEYLFYLDWEGRLEGPALEGARTTTTWWKLLGIYPKGKILVEP